MRSGYEGLHLSGGHGDLLVTLSGHHVVAHLRWHIVSTGLNRFEHYDMDIVDNYRRDFQNLRLAGSERVMDLVMDFAKIDLMVWSLIWLCLKVLERKKTKTMV